MTYFCIIFVEKYFFAKYLRFYTSTKNFIKIRPKMSKRKPIKKKTFFYLLTLLTYSALQGPRLYSICWQWWRHQLLGRPRWWMGPILWGKYQGWSPRPAGRRRCPAPRGKGGAPPRAEKKRLLPRPAPQNTIAAQPRPVEVVKLRGVCGAKWKL